MGGGRDSREASEKELIYFFQLDTRIDEGLKMKVETKTETTVTKNLFVVVDPDGHQDGHQDGQYLRYLSEWVVLPLRYSHCGCENFHTHESVNNRFPQSLLDTTLFEISFSEKTK